jgi:cellulose synthase/poly-beta-1,6-N-acetylglucosamine synthase-like glycosyltransferase
MIVACALVVLAVPVLAWTSYLAALSLLSGDNTPPPYPPEPATRFDAIVPAHDEEIGIAATVESLLATDYPAERRRVLVVADNCSDATAERAREAGAIVIERVDPQRRGKGYALARAFEQTLSDGFANAVVVVDADTRVTPNLLRAFDARLAAGLKAIQADDAVANRFASWRTRLMHIAFTLFIDLRSRARERMRISVGLHGNGMCFATTLLKEVPHEAFSVVEDLEYGIRIGRAGHRVAYAGEARVESEMASTAAASQSQRERWEGGRFALAKQNAPRLLAEGLRRRSLLLLDLAADLLVPPLTYVALATVVGLGVSLACALLRIVPSWAVAPWGAAAACFGLYLARGIWLSRVGPRAILDLLWAPVYMTWKILLLLRRSPAKSGTWVRTAREGQRP